MMATLFPSRNPEVMVIKFFWYMNAGPQWKKIDEQSGNNDQVDTHKCFADTILQKLTQNKARGNR